MVDYRADTIGPKTPAGDILVTLIGPCVCLSERSDNLPQVPFFSECIEGALDFPLQCLLNAFF